MNEQRFVVTDQVWQQLEPHLPGKASDAGTTAKDNRLFLETVFWRIRTGSPWRDLPPVFGNWNNQFRRLRRWAKAGIFESPALCIKRTNNIAAYRADVNHHVAHAGQELRAPNPFTCPAGVLDTGTRRYWASEIMTALGDAMAEPA